ncbi:hypothetical protein PENANT_c023G01789 [Penicillium antarcticum]|uniref:Threonine/serine exporter-like N-terminal domain-containing protein n=1 Tax=Penicillium antarcticum TaxID=416450 RepID=A0A1V6PZ00_9EURO|nr:DUF1212-domain-containing protein [Penicillium antarcticum]KAJ5301400.1 DUF1212-domain-containing protein [Penicillium antarcticum]OQD82181.1 hypothetical protein PENANT_c023G01789 [Penicillium antarcticum]
MPYGGQSPSDEKLSDSSGSEQQERLPPPAQGTQQDTSVNSSQNNIRRSISEKAKTLSTRLFHPSSNCDETAAVADDNLMDLGNHRSEDFSANSGPLRLAEGLMHERSDQHANYSLRSSTVPEPRHRESHGGVLAQLLKFYSGLDPPTQDTRPLNEPLPRVGTPRAPFTGNEPYHKDDQKGKGPDGNQLYPSMNTTVGEGSSLGARSPIPANEIPSGAFKWSKWANAHGGRRVRLEDEIHVAIHIADIISRQRYIIELCKALMKFGAPMHRLEEHMHMTATVLEVESQYLYVPGCMIMSFDDPTTRTTEVKLVRMEQGIDLGLLADTHDVYKNVVHDVIGVEEATSELKKILDSRPRFNKWIIVLMYGLASAMVGPFAFNARPIDMPIIFFNGTLLGVLHHLIAPRSALYNNVFEVTASVFTSFIARAIGSIEWDAPHGDQEYLFCFAAIAKSSIALILPGYTVLSSSLELQSHQLVAGSIRMVYAIIYSLFLGFGVTVGTTIYGLIDPGATSRLTCPATGEWTNEYAPRFPFVAAFVLCLLVISQGRWKQAPMMLFIAEAGYVVTYFVTRRIGSSSQVANTVGAFTIGVIGNLYSRLWHGHAATSILPGIFVLVPSGLAASGPLLSGIKSADETRDNVSVAINHSTYTNYGVEASQTYTANLGFGMVEVSIGITVGLFLAALLIYPFGKRRSGLFSF